MKALTIGYAALAIAALAAPAHARDLSGNWAGTYSYDGGAAPSVGFTAALRFKDDEFSGKTSEPNTFGDPSAKRLKANLSGLIGPTGAVNFTKTYDGTGGVSHSVDYAGYLEANQICISGSWSIGGAPGGTFRMCRGPRLVS